MVVRNPYLLYSYGDGGAGVTASHIYIYVCMNSRVRDKLRTSTRVLISPEGVEGRGKGCNVFSAAHPSDSKPLYECARAYVLFVRSHTHASPPPPHTHNPRNNTAPRTVYVGAKTNYGGRFAYSGFRRFN
jgi:hypothetical protein